MFCTPASRLNRFVSLSWLQCKHAKLLYKCKSLSKLVHKPRLGGGFKPVSNRYAAVHIVQTHTHTTVTLLCMRRGLKKDLVHIQKGILTPNFVSGRNVIRFRKTHHVSEIFKKNDQLHICMLKLGIKSLLTSTITLLQEFIQDYQIPVLQEGKIRHTPTL